MTEPLYAQTCDQSAHHLCSAVGCRCCANGHGLNDLGDPVPYRIPVDVDVAADGGAQAMTCDCQEAPCQHETTEPRFTREVPMDFNGYVPVARQAVRILAVFIEPGDTLLLDGHISRVTHVNVRDLGTGKHLLNPGMTVPEIVATYASGPRWPVLHITGDYNIIRGPHELVSVIRDNEEGRGLLAPEEIQESVEEARAEGRRAALAPVLDLIGWWETDGTESRKAAAERIRGVLRADAPSGDAQEQAWDEGCEAGMEWTPSGPNGSPHDPPSNPYGTSPQ